MPVLDYTTAPHARRASWRWGIAVIVGAAIGLGVAVATYEPVLRMLSRGTPLEVFDVAEPFEQQARFSGALAFSGALVGRGALAVSRLAGRGGVAAWALALAACFTAAAGAGLVYARDEWNPVGRNAGPVVTAGLSPGLPPVFAPGLPLASAPVLTPVVAGVVAVLLVLSLVVVRRAAAAWLAE